MDTHLVTDRYLQGNLTEGEKIEFEERLVWDQELIDELDLAERLRDGLRETLADDRYTVRPGPVSLVARLSDALAVPRYAAAASFLLAVTLSSGVLMSPMMTDRNGYEFQAMPTEIIPLLVVRGSNVPQVIYSEDTTTVLLIDAIGTYASYRVTIRKDEPGIAPIWAQDRMLPTYLESLAVSMPGDLLTPGRYLLAVEGMQVSETGEQSFEHIQDIRFDASIEQ